MIANHVRLVLTDGAAMTILVYEEEGLDEPHREKIRERKRVYAHFLRDTIAGVFERRPEIGIDPSVAAFSILGMIHWLVRWYNPNGRLGEEEVVEQLTRLILHGLLPPPGAAADTEALLPTF